MNDEFDELDEEQPEAESDTSPRDLFWIGSCVVITTLATLLRFADLALKPLHHDEGVNGFFLTNLFRNGDYKYDPANYHGPTLYYIAMVFTKLFGLNTISIRASVAIFGVAMVVLCFYLRRYIGTAGSLFAALFVALSPGMVFISRYFIHEIFFVFLSLAMVVAVAFFIEQRPAGIVSIVLISIVLLTCLLGPTVTLTSHYLGDSGTGLAIARVMFFVVEIGVVFFAVRALIAWDEGRPIYFLLAVACLALLFATKETAFITVGTMFIAAICVSIWMRIRKPAAESEISDIDDNATVVERFFKGIRRREPGNLIVCRVSCIDPWLMLFSSPRFLLSTKLRSGTRSRTAYVGLLDAYTIWAKTGNKDHTQNGYWAYFRWGMRMEAPIFILSRFGILVAFVQRPVIGSQIFTGLWAFGLLAAYTIIPYKTPWLDLSFLLPMCIMSGYVIGQFVEGTSNQAIVSLLSVGIAAAAVMAYQTYDLSFVRYADNDMPYVYAHTYEDFNGLVAAIDHYAEKSGKGRDATVEIVSPDYWPLVWYLKDFNHANFWGRIIDVNCPQLQACSEMIVAKKEEKDAEVIRKYSSRYGCSARGVCGPASSWSCSSGAILRAREPKTCIKFGGTRADQPSPSKRRSISASSSRSDRSRPIATSSCSTSMACSSGSDRVRPLGGIHAVKLGEDLVSPPSQLFLVCLTVVHDLISNRNLSIPYFENKTNAILRIRGTDHLE